MSSNSSQADSSGSPRGRATSTSDDATPIVTCDEVVREYERGATGGWMRRSRTGPTVRALDGVSLSVQQGEFVGIAGPSGSGKTTLLHILGALDTPTSGSVRLAQTDIETLSDRARTRLRLDHVGIVFQQFHLLPSLSARANVALPLVERGVGKRDRRQRAGAKLKQVGLSDRATHKPGELSGGEQQRVAIARALVTEPDLLVADEPTGELDSESGGRVLDLFEDATADCGVILASHDERALDRVDRVLRLVDGRVVDP